jgi:hypothetical protein
LSTDAVEFFAILAIFGIESAINLGGPEMVRGSILRRTLAILTVSARGTIENSAF